MSKGSSKILGNSIYNLLGWLLPLIVNFLTVPLVVRMLGNDSYGILMLFTAVIGYFSIIDINLTAGSMKYISEYYAKGDEKSLNEVLTLSLWGYVIIGIFGAAIMYLSVDWFLMDLLKVPQDLKVAARVVFQLASVGFFLNLVQKYLSSIPQSIHRFDVSAKIEAGFGVALMVLTVVMLYMGFELSGVVVLRVLILVFNCVAIFMAVKKIMPFACFNSRVSGDIVRKMKTFSGYSFLSSAATSITANFDRLVIGSVISSAAVTFYSIPFMLVARLMTVSQRLSMVLFPVASEIGALGKREDIYRIYIKMNRHVFFLNIALTAVICLFSKQILSIWMGDEFAQKTYVILILISLGYFADTLTNLPSLVNDGFNFPQITGFFALARAIVGVVALLFGTIHYGLIGAATAYLLSSYTVGILFLLYVHKKTIKLSLWTVVRDAFMKSFLFTAVVASGVVLSRLFYSASMISLLAESFSVFIVFVLFAYRYVVEENIKMRIIGYFR
ncbi:hypothetical protein C4544_02105 [candidate division WS5 bacterium]|uniref:Polysaccharide biosynthesis protein C-terminal domain-containing protein n=1 Tax=candidate division WS5 bacterium TaxID=2093353 RepID=A0A419DEW0_9BACT|nr:MAG: hypothetical protein C4544_02105 [candidate division WS5 bacterium]